MDVISCHITILVYESIKDVIWISSHAICVPWLWTKLIPLSDLSGYPIQKKTKNILKAIKRCLAWNYWYIKYVFYTPCMLFACGNKTIIFFSPTFLACTPPHTSTLLSTALPPVRSHVGGVLYRYRIPTHWSPTPPKEVQIPRWSRPQTASPIQNSESACEDHAPPDNPSPG